MERIEWRRVDVEHLWDEHELTPDEVEEALADGARCPFDASPGPAGDRARGERRRGWLGRTADGVLPVVVLGALGGGRWRCVTAYQGGDHEARLYRRQRRRRGRRWP